MTTIKDISRECGVSPATVSKALNGYDDISAETIELVKRTARKLNYMPNAAARLLKTNRSHNIGVLFVDDTMSGLTHEFFSLILNSAKDEAEELGYDITFINRRMGGRSYSFLQHCRYRNFDGVLIASVDFTNPDVIELIDSEIPVVAIDYSCSNATSILSDNTEGAYQLALHLADNGHERIAFIHGEDTLVTASRISGYRKALAERGIEARPEYLVGARYHDAASVGRATEYLLDLPEVPTAIMFPDDYSYVGGKTVLNERGLRVPDDISVCGYDGISLSGIMQPPLTTWYQDADKIGRISMCKLAEAIDAGRGHSKEEIMVSGKLINGGSVRSI